MSLFLDIYNKTNFFPDTYTSSNRTKRAIDNDEMINMMDAEKRLVTELGENVCIYPKVCLHHAEKARRTGGGQKVEVEWNDIFRLVTDSEIKYIMCGPDSLYEDSKSTYMQFKFLSMTSLNEIYNVHRHQPVVIVNSS